MFPFESQLKSHCHMHRQSRNYICASPNCGKTFKHPGDLVSHARSHGKLLKCVHCSYANPDIRNLKSHLSGYHADTPITIKAEPSIWPTAAFINIHEYPI